MVEEVQIVKLPSLRQTHKCKTSLNGLNAQTRRFSCIGLSSDNSQTSLIGQLVGKAKGLK